MIKKLRLKFVLVFLVLVVSVFITSSCYASLTEDNFISFDTLNSGITMEDVYSYIESQNGDHYLDDYDLSKFYAYYNSESNVIQFRFFKFEGLEYIITNYSTSGRYIGSAYNSSDTKFGGSMQLKVMYDINTATFSKETGSVSINSVVYLDSTYIDSGIISFLDITSVDMYYENKDTLIHSCDSYTSTNTSFVYSLYGIKRGQVELKIEDFDFSLTMYGFVNFENIYEVGDILDTTANIDKLRLLSMYSDNSDLSCILYEGESLTYYIVDENNIILNIGNINELAEGYFLYGFPVSDGVDFVFLNDGQVYWNSDLIFKYQVDNGSLLTKNEIVSTGSYSYIESNKTSAKINYNGFVYDSSGEVIATAVTSTTNNLSSFYIKEVNTNYYEVHTLIYDLSYYWIQSIILNGTDSSGNDIDFSNYYIRWSVPTWLTVDSIEVGTSEYDKYNGVISGFSSNGVLSIQLKICESLKDHTSDFDIQLEIYDNNGDLVTTYIINSDDIVRNQILSEENNIDRPSYDIIDNPNYTGGSNNYPSSDNIHNWGVDDFSNYLGTNNTMFNFFWAFLNNMPTWISTPLTILLIGLVVITLYKFIRG